MRFTFLALVLAVLALVLTSGSHSGVECAQIRQRQQVQNQMMANTGAEAAEAIPIIDGTLPSGITINDNNGSVSADLQTTNWNDLPDWARYLLAALAIVVGMIQVFYGYKFFPFSIFMITGAVAYVVMFGILTASISNDDPNKTAYVYGFSIAAFIIIGAIMVCLRYVAIFVVGASIGVVVAIVLNPIALRYIWPENPTANLYIWMIVFGLVTGVLVLYFERPLLIIATVLVGSLLTILGIGGIAGNLPVLSNVEAGVSSGDVDSIPWETWAYLGGFLALLIAGLCVQFLVTAKNINHSNKRKKDNSAYGRLQH